MEFWDALEDSQYLDAITSTQRGPRPLCKWEIPTPQELIEWEERVRQKDQQRRQREQERLLQKRQKRQQHKKKSEKQPAAAAAFIIRADNADTTTASASKSVQEQLGQQQTPSVEIAPTELQEKLMTAAPTTTTDATTTDTPVHTPPLKQPPQEDEDRVEPLTLEWYLGSPIGFFFFSSFLKEHDVRNKFNLPTRRSIYDFANNFSDRNANNNQNDDGDHMVVTTTAVDDNNNATPISHRIPNNNHNNGPCIPSIQMNFLEDLIRFQAILQKKSSRSKRVKLAKRLLRYLLAPVQEDAPPETTTTIPSEAEQPQQVGEQQEEEDPVVTMKPQQESHCIRLIYDSIPRLTLIHEDDLHLHPKLTSRKKLGCFTQSQLDAAYTMNFDPSFRSNVVGLKGPILLELMQVLELIMDANRSSNDNPLRHSSTEIPSRAADFEEKSKPSSGMASFLQKHTDTESNNNKQPNGKNHCGRNRCYASSVTDDSDEDDDTGVDNSVRSAPINLQELIKIEEPKGGVAAAQPAEAHQPSSLVGSNDADEPGRTNQDDMLAGSSTMPLGAGLEQAPGETNESPRLADTSTGSNGTAPPTLLRSDTTEGRKTTAECKVLPVATGGKRAEDISLTLTLHQRSIFVKAEAIIVECFKRNYDDEFQGRLVTATAATTDTTNGELPAEENGQLQPHPFYVRMRNFLWYGDRRVVYDDFFIMRVLGRGGFGLVNACQKGTTGKLYAVKTMDKRRIKSKKSTNFVLCERQALAAVSGSPFIINLKYCFHSQDEIFLVMDLMTGGDLGFHLSLKRRFSMDQCLYYAARIMLGLQALHDKGFVYRDMKPDNCLLSEDGRVKITDLGLAMKTSPRLPVGLAGTRGYWAPEMHKRDDASGKRVPYNHVVDWFSFGCCLAEFVSGNNPFRTEAAVRFGMDRGEESKDNALDVAIQEMEPDVSSDHFTPEAADLCRRLLEKNPKSRLGAHGGCEEIMAHPWFQSVRWADVISDRQRPPFIPANDVNAASQHEIGDFADASSKEVRSLILDEEDEVKFKDWDWTNPQAYCSEVLEFVTYERDLGRPLVPEGPNGDLCCLCCNIL